MRTAVLVLILLSATSLCAQPAVLTPEQRVVHALARLTFGPKPGDVERVAALGLERWISSQLEPEKIDDPRARQIANAYPGLGLLAKERAALRAEAEKEVTGTMEEQERRKERLTRDPNRELRLAIVERAACSERQLFEVMVDFWRNHFNVDTAKDSVGVTATHYEEAVLRRHALGRFEPFLMDTAKHPAMLVYLDNHLSRRPPGKQELARIERDARRRTGSRERAQQQVELALERGLNENYARELMELHTLGVDNGYTQKDVEEVARAFTGWTISRAEDDYAFRFAEEMHDPGQKYFLEKPLPLARGESGILEGESILQRLASHKNSSEFIVRKLCVRLVSDTPPADLVDWGAKAFRRTKGDIRETVRAIVDHPAFFDPAHFQCKFKTPLEFVISAVRATNAMVDEPQRLVDAIFELGLEIYGCEDPTGYSDTTEAWRDPGVMALRWKFAMDLVRGKLDGVRVPESLYEGLPSDALQLSAALATRLVPQGLGRDTKRVLERVLFREVQKAGGLDRLDRPAVARLLAGIMIGCPEFQQQ